MIIDIIKSCTRIFPIIFREIFIYVASLFLWFIYSFLIRTGEYFLADVVVFIPLIVMVILNVVAMLKYKKYIKKVSIIGAVIGLIIIIGANEMVCMQYGKFSPEKWKNNQSIRHFMIDDLTENYLEENMAVTEVESILGQTSEIFKNEGELEQKISYYYSYYGYHERVSKDLYLNIYFDLEDKIVGWKFYEEDALWN